MCNKLDIYVFIWKTLNITSLEYAKINYFVYPIYHKYGKS
jgi:hypothetical protein